MLRGDDMMIVNDPLIVASSEQWARKDTVSLATCGSVC